MADGSELLPLCDNAVVATRRCSSCYDADLVDMTLGTGCKITSGSDHNEFESGHGHGLALIDLYKQLGSSTARLRQYKMLYVDDKKAPEFDCMIVARCLRRSSNYTSSTTSSLTLSATTTPQQRFDLRRCGRCQSEHVLRFDGLVSRSSTMSM